MTNLFDPAQRPLPSVTNSSEFQRIAALPRRVLDLTQDTSPYFVKPTSNLKVWPIQSAALIEASKANGLFAPIPVGKGKTFICLALPDVMESKKAVILVKPQLRDQLKEEIDSFYAVNFNLPLDRITIVAYSELSAQSGAFILEEIMPDLIVADEAHCLRHRESARSKRFFRYMREHPACRFAALSGTMTNRNISDYAHLIELALKKNSPLPRSYHELQDWAGALDVKPERITLPGRLLTFCRGTESVREGFQRRVNETPGVVTARSTEDDVGASLTIQRIMFEVPDAVVEAYEAAKENWEFETEIFTNPMELQRFLCQISCGFYYRWVWPNGIVDTEWMEARKAWNHEVRQALKRSRAGFDSPGLLEKAAEAGTWKSSTWAAWQAVKNRPEPPTATVWIKQYLHIPVLSWIRAIGDARGIIWYEHDAVGKYLADFCDLPLYDPSKDPRNATEQVIVASLAAHGDGKNLQAFSRQLWTSLPPNGTKVEQGIGRCHRPGQLEDTVEVSWFGQTEALGAAFQKVLLDAEYVEQTTGYRQKVLYASRLTTDRQKDRKKK